MPTGQQKVIKSYGLHQLGLRSTGSENLTLIHQTKLEFVLMGAGILAVP
jgi:hypothetical protein